MEIRRRFVARCGGALVALLILGALAGTVRADFALWNDEQYTVVDREGVGLLWDTSHVLVALPTSEYPLPYVHRLHLYDSGSAELVGGHVEWFYAYDSSAVDLRGIADVYYGYAWGHSHIAVYDWGEVRVLRLEEHATASIYGGLVGTLYAHDEGVVDISGGEVNSLRAYDFSLTRFHVQDFRLGAGLSLDGQRILGDGYLACEWMDGSRGITQINQYQTAARVELIPEPATLALVGLGLGVLALRRRRAKT